MTAKRKLPIGVKPDWRDWADLPERWDKRCVYRYCYYGEGHDREPRGYHYLVPETDEWDYEHDNGGSICAFTKDESGVVVEGEAS